jgi:hypothetical protein
MSRVLRLKEHFILALFQPEVQTVSKFEFMFGRDHQHLWVTDNWEELIIYAGHYMDLPTKSCELKYLDYDCIVASAIPGWSNFFLSSVRPKGQETPADTIFEN